MATELSFVMDAVHRMKEAGPVTFRKMFGEYGIYLNGKMAALICDHQLFFKTTVGGLALIKNPVLQSPYPGAKPCLLIKDLENSSLLCRLLQVTAQELPETKPKKKKKPEL